MGGGSDNNVLHLALRAPYCPAAIYASIFFLLKSITFGAFALAYTVVSLDESEVLGCIYIFPTRNPGYDAEITMWVRQSRVDEGLDEHLFETVKPWIADCWPLENPAYPGRTIAFKDWRALH